MKREKNENGYRTCIINVRLTEVEKQILDKLYENACKESEGLLKSDFMRMQLLHKNQELKEKAVAREIKKLRSELDHAMKMAMESDNREATEIMESEIDNCFGCLSDIADELMLVNMM